MHRKVDESAYSETALSDARKRNTFENMLEVTKLDGRVRYPGRGCYMSSDHSYYRLFPFLEKLSPGVCFPGVVLWGCAVLCLKVATIIIHNDNRCASKLGIWCIS